MLELQFELTPGGSITYPALELLIEVFEPLAVIQISQLISYAMYSYKVYALRKPHDLGLWTTADVPAGIVYTDDWGTYAGPM